MLSLIQKRICLEANIPLRSNISFFFNKKIISNRKYEKTKRKQFQVIQTTTIETLPCESHNAKPYVCVKSPGCGWCQRRRKCIQGKRSGPTQIDACSYYDNYVFDVPKGFYE